MIIECPECKSRYSIDPQALKLTGRSVRCARCKHVWHQMPPQDQVKPVDIIVEEPTPSFKLNEPVKETLHRAKTSNLGWYIFLILLLLMLAFLWFGQSKIIHLWPDTKPFYELLHTNDINKRLQIVGANAQPETIDGVTYLIVTGAIVNLTKEEITPPALKCFVYDEHNQEITSWSFVAEQTIIKPESRITFTSRLENPPPQAKRFDVMFVESSLEPARQ